ncbi:hypothetical protein ACWDKQ_36045 [Saccharopolyspora sp. NPDC000995]
MPVVFEAIKSPSTVGTFLWSFTHGHAVRLHRVHQAFLTELAAETPLPIARTASLAVCQDTLIPAAEGGWLFACTTRSFQDSGDWQMVAPLGPVVGVSVHEHWFGVLEEIASFPAQTQVLAWLRRRDIRGRESVGHLLAAVNDTDGVRLFDPMDGRAQPLIETAPFELRVMRFDS